MNSNRYKILITKFSNILSNRYYSTHRFPNITNFSSHNKNNSYSRLSCAKYCVNSIKTNLTKKQADELALRLTDEERNILGTALREFEANAIKDEYVGQLAATRWRSKFGRPSKVPKLGDVDPTGTFCLLPEDWLRKKYAETVPPPTRKDLTQLFVVNAVPFIGFGFLDNFIMIVAGDRIEHTMGLFMTISTMAAAALGNTFSDVIGIGSAFYVERAAALVGIKAPKLSPVQLDMPSAHRAGNMGRVVGIVIGCFLGMIPLLFMDTNGLVKIKTDDEITNNTEQETTNNSTESIETKKI